MISPLYHPVRCIFFEIGGPGAKKLADYEYANSSEQSRHGIRSTEIARIQSVLRQETPRRFYLAVSRELDDALHPIEESLLERLADIVLNIQQEILQEFRHQLGQMAPSETGTYLVATVEISNRGPG